MRGFHHCGECEVLSQKIIEALEYQIGILSQKIDLLTAENKEYAGSISKLSEMVYEIKKRSEKDGLKIAKEQIAEIDAIWTSIFNDAHPVDARFEREYYKTFPVCTSQEAPDFQAEFLSLVDGLDEESIETIVLAIQRIKLIQNSTEPVMVLYSEEEKQKMREIKEHFASNIIKLSEKSYYFRGYLLPINHFEACVFWNKCGIDFLENPRLLIGKDIIDAGAYIGDSSLILSKFTHKKVYAFEPVPSNYEMLMRTIELNALCNVVPCPYALGEKTGMVQISVNDSCSTQFVNNAFKYKENINVNVVTLDEYVQRNNLKVGLIKVDIEGAEQLLLQGAMETIKSQRPALLVSIYHNRSDFFSIKPTLEKLNLGYKFKIRHPAGGSVMTEMILIAEIG